MQGNQVQTQLSAQRSTNSPTTSVRGQSLSTIQAAIRSPHDQGATLKRANSILSLYYDPDFDAETKADARAAFVRALAEFPDWAVQRAFDQWERSMQRRPSPAEIVILVGREMKPLTDEVNRHEKEAAEMEQSKREAEITPEEMARRREFAQGVMQRNGFAKDMPRDRGPRRETVTDQDFSEMAALLNKGKP